MLQDIHDAVRGLARTPGFTVVAILALALGIGGATVIFSVADAVMLRPLPYADSDRLVVIWQNDRTRNQAFVEVSYPSFRYWREQSQLFQGLAGMPAVNQDMTLTGRGEATSVAGRWVTGEFFAVLGVTAALGRAFTPDDDKAGAPAVVVLSDAFWRAQFGADRGAIGESITLNGTPHTIVGVMPSGFAYPKGAQFWVPLGPPAGALLENDGVQWMIVLGRLKENVTFASAQIELTELWRRLHHPQFDPSGFSVVMTPLADTIFGTARPALLGLLAAVVLVLLIACANVSGLLIVRAANRRSDVVLRYFLGASRARLASSALVESTMLAAGGGVVGLLIAASCMPLIQAAVPADVPRVSDIVVDTRTFMFAALIATLAAIVSALMPIVSLSRSSLDALPQQSRQRLVAGRTRVGDTLVVVQISVAIVVVAAAGLVGRSFMNLRAVPLGFQPETVIAAGISLRGARYEDRKPVRAFYEQLLERIRGVPGIDAASAITHRPLWSTVGYDWPFTVEGQGQQEAQRNPLLNLMAVSSDYFRTMGIPLNRGREFTDRDAEGQPGVVIVSESLARRVWPGENALGKRVRIPLPDTPYHNQWLTVVGVAGDARYRELTAARLDFYLSHLQADAPPNYLMVRTTRDVADVASVIRAIVRDLDGDVPVTEITPMEQVVSTALGNSRFSAQLFGAFGLTALLLASLGVYGLMAYTVACRTREIAVRMALGAQQSVILRHILTRGLKLASIGLVVGLVVAVMVMRVLETLLFGLESTDGVTMVGVTGLMLLVATLACLAPAMRAARVDPLVALRYE